MTYLIGLLATGRPEYKKGVVVKLSVFEIKGMGYYCIGYNTQDGTLFP